jgi:hypothetical protein
VERDVHETAVAVGPHAGDTGNRRRIEHSVADDAQPARPFGHQHAAIREEHETPRVREALGDDADANLLLLGGIEFKRPHAQRGHGQSDVRPLSSVTDSKHADDHERDHAG